MSSVIQRNFVSFFISSQNYMINNIVFNTFCTIVLSFERPESYSVLKSVYFFGSFAFLVARTIAVTLLAARINDQSRVALPALYNCPASTYNVEVNRCFTHTLAVKSFIQAEFHYFAI